MAKTIALIIEDPDVLGMMEAVFAAENYETVGFRPSRRDLAREVADARPDVILLDVPLGRPAFPVQDALDLIAALRADPATRGIPIVVCATVEQVLVTHRPHLDALRCDFIAKPFEVTELLERVARHLQPRAA